MSGLILIVIGLIAIVVLVGIIFVLIAWKKIKKEGYKEPDYRVFFIMGLLFLVMGIILLSYKLHNVSFCGLLYPSLPDHESNPIKRTVSFSDVFFTLTLAAKG